MKLQQLRDLVAIAEHGSLRAAARAMNVAQPVLTRSLAEVAALCSEERLEMRYDKFRNMGRLGIDFTDGGS